MKRFIRLLCWSLATMVMAENSVQQNKDADLALLAIKEIKIPLEHLQQTCQEFGWLESPKLVVDVKRNSTLIWRTPAINYDGKDVRNTFRYDLSVAENSMPFFLSPNDEFIFEVYLVSNDVSVQTWRGLGCTGEGVGFPLGLTSTPIGASGGVVIGAVEGGSVGGVLPIETLIKVVEFKVLGKDLYAREHIAKIETTAFIDEEKKYAQLTLAGQRVGAIKNDGELRENGEYLCRLRNLRLSSSTKGVKKSGEYYAKIYQDGNEEVEIQFGEIPLDTEWPLEGTGLFLLKNKLGTGSVQIFRDAWGIDPLVFETSLGSSTKGDTWLYSGKIESEDELCYVTFETFPWASTEKANLLKKWSDIKISLSRASSLDDVKAILQTSDYQMIVAKGEQYGIDVSELKKEVAEYQIIAELKDAIKGGDETRVKEICVQRTQIRKPVNVDSLTEKIVRLKAETINSLLENKWLSDSALSKFIELNYGLIQLRVKPLLEYTYEVKGVTPLARIILNESRLTCLLSYFDECDDSELVRFLLLNDKISITGAGNIFVAQERWGGQGIDEIVLVRQLKSRFIRIERSDIDGGKRTVLADGGALPEIDNTYGYITTLWNSYGKDIQQVILTENFGNDEGRLTQAKKLGDACRNEQNFKNAVQWYRKCWKFAKRNFQVVDDAKTELITLYSKGEIILPFEEAEQLYNYHPEQKAYKERREFTEVLNDVLGKRESLKDEYLKMLLKMEIVKEEKLVDQRLSSSLWALIYQYKPSFFVENDGLKNERFKGELFLEANPNNFVGLATCCLLYGKVEKIKIAAGAVKERFPNEKKDDKPEPLVSFHLWLKDAYKLRRLLDGFKSATDLSAIGQFYINLIEQKDNHDTEPLVYALEKIFKEQKWGVDSLNLFETYCRVLEENGRRRIREHIKANYPQKSERALTALGISEKGENSQSE